MKRFLILTKAIFLMYLRNGFVLFWNFAFPVLLMLIYGVVMRQYGRVAPISRWLARTRLG